MTSFKFWVQLLGAALAAGLPALVADGPLTPAHWINAVVIGIGAAVVWNTANGPAWPYGKVVASAATAVGAAVIAALSDGTWTWGEGIQIVIALLTAVGVYVAPNRPAVPAA